MQGIYFRELENKLKEEENKEGRMRDFMGFQQGHLHAFMITHTHTNDVHRVKSLYDAPLL